MSTQRTIASIFFITAILLLTGLFLIQPMSSHTTQTTGFLSFGNFHICVNNQPQIQFSCPTLLRQGTNYACQLQAQDYNGDQLNYSYQQLNGTLEVNISNTGLITTNPNASMVGNATLRFIVDDGRCGDHQAYTDINFTILSNETLAGQFPEGYYYNKPTPLPPAGNYQYNFTITLTNIDANASDYFECTINESNCYDAGLPGCKQIRPNTTISTPITNGNVSITYVINDNDIINSTGGGTSDNWIPWRITSCAQYDASHNLKKLNDSINWRIHVRPITWTVGDIANAVNAKSQENMFFQNTITTNKDGDVVYAVAKYGGAKTELNCHDNQDNPEEPDTLSDSADPDCWGITYSNKPNLHHSFTTPTTWYSPSGSHGTLAYNIPAGDINDKTTTFSGPFGETKIEYTMHTMPNGTFKIRFRHWGLSKTATIIAEGFPKINNVTKIAPGTTSDKGAILYFLDKNNIPKNQNTLNETETHEHKILLRSYQAGGTEEENLDTTLLVTFADPTSIDMSQGYNLNLTFNYLEGLVSYEDTETITIYFDDPTYTPPPNDTRPRWNSTNNNEWETRLDDSSMTWGPCNDTKNGDFDYLNCAGNEQNCFEQSSYDCYDPDCNNKPGTPAWNDYTGMITTGKCALTNEHLDDASCFDGYNNDWASEDTTWGHANNNLQLVDCRDQDCDTIWNPNNNTQQCQYLIERNCTDGFDNDMWNDYDCHGTLAGSYNDAEYDCATHCRATIDNDEKGNECDDGIDNDWDLWKTTTGGQNGYAYNTTYGAGIDCHWGGAYGIGPDNHPDEDCNAETLSNGKTCDLNRELHCTDGFDNDYDHEANTMPRPGWTNNPTLYNQLFGTNPQLSADFDDYDCANNTILQTQAPNESVNDTWCFDNVDNDLDAYYWTGTGYAQNTTGGGKDCYDSDCVGKTNPNNPYDVCLAHEFNASDPYFQTLPRIDFFCDNGIDDDVDASSAPLLLGHPQKDCWDQDCNQAFDGIGGLPYGICYACPSIEMNHWDSCADGQDNDYDAMTDTSDPDCQGQIATYNHQFYLGTENNNDLCTDGYDNDGDGKTDCQDNDCWGIGNCNSETTITTCNDDIDNDGDGLLDCEDPDCTTQTSCTTNTDMSGTYSPPATSSGTFDGLHTTWTSRVRVGENFTMHFTFGSYDSTAYIWLGNLLGNALSVGKGLQAENFTLAGPTANNFETKEYSTNTNATKAQIALQDADPGTGANNIDITITIPTNQTKYVDSFELNHNIILPSTGNTIYYRILDNKKPTIHNIISEPSANTFNIKYDGHVWFAINASDEEHGDYQDGTIDSCFYNVTGPNGYTDSGSDATDCKIEITNIKESGTYTFTFWARDDTGNLATPQTITKTIHILPIYKDGSASITTHFINNSEQTTYQAEFLNDNPQANDECALKYKAVDGTTQTYTTTNPIINGNTITCEANFSGNGFNDDLYGVWFEYKDSNNVKTNANKKSLFVCNTNTSSGTGTNGEKWNCQYDPDNIASTCNQYPPPTVNLTTPADNSQLTTGTSQTFTCHAESNAGLYNISITIWDLNTHNTTYTNWTYITGTSNSTTWTINNLSQGYYEWNCQATNLDFTSSWGDANRTFAIGTTTTTPPGTSGSGGGSGGFIGCQPLWYCTPWTTCTEDGKQNQTCHDLTNCTTNIIHAEQDCTPHCANGIQDYGEEGIDCGVSCGNECPTCDDGIQNQGEKGIDCGGPNCYSCPTCYDGVQNQGEEGIDCGGPFCQPCSNCFDNKQDWGEEGIDCGGPCATPCEEKPSPTQTQTQIVLLLLLLLLLLALVPLFCSYKKTFCAIIKAKLRWFFTKKKKKQILITSQQKKELLAEIQHIGEFIKHLPREELKEGIFDSLEVAHHKIKLLKKHIFTILAKNNGFKELNEKTIKHLPTTKHLKTVLNEFNKEELHNIAEFIHENKALLKANILLEQTREIIFSISKIDVEDVARPLHEETLNSLQTLRTQQLIYNATLALQVEELSIAKTKYLKALKLYEHLPREDKKEIYHELNLLFNQIHYVVAYVDHS